MDRPPRSDVSATRGARLVGCVARGVALAGAAYALGLYVLLALYRMRYPFELEWMEGGAVDHVTRLLAGQRLYVEPTLDFVPFIYPPFYFQVSALFAAVMGGGLFPLRLVSFLASLACFALLYRMVVRETGSRVGGAVAAGIYAATFRASGAWMDIARVDSLFLALLLGGAYLLRFGAGVRAYAIGGGLLGLSFLTKQTALPIALPLLGYLALWRRAGGKGLVASAVFAAVAGLPTLYYNAASDGWYGYYVFRLPRQHDLVNTWISYWTQDLLENLWPAIAVALGYLVVRIRLGAAARVGAAPAGFYLVFLLGALGASYASRLHSGHYDNVLFPAFAAVALGAGLGLGVMLGGDRTGVALAALAARVRARLTGTIPGPVTHDPVPVLAPAAAPISATRPRAAALSPRARVWLGAQLALCLGLAGQVALLHYDPLRQLPTRADRTAGRALISRLAQLPGEIYLPFHGHLGALAGKKTHAQGMAVSDVLRGRPPQSTALTQQIAQALARRRFSFIVADASNWFLPDIDRSYRFHSVVFDRPDVFIPVTGFPTRPEVVFVAR